MLLLFIEDPRVQYSFYFYNIRYIFVSIKINLPIVSSGFSAFERVCVRVRMCERKRDGELLIKVYQNSKQNSSNQNEYAHKMNARYVLKYKNSSNWIPIGIYFTQMSTMNEFIDDVT